MRDLKISYVMSCHVMSCHADNVAAFFVEIELWNERASGDLGECGILTFFFSLFGERGGGAGCEKERKPWGFQVSVSSTMMRVLADWESEIGRIRVVYQFGVYKVFIYLYVSDK